MAQASVVSSWDLPKAGDGRSAAMGEEEGEVVELTEEVRDKMFAERAERFLEEYHYRIMFVGAKTIIE